MTTATAVVEARGIRFAFSERGSGPVVLYAHGLTSSRENTARMGLGDFAAVAERGYRVISYDARGHGGSEGTMRSGDYTWAALGEDMIALADVFSPDAPIVGIGASMGTGALLYAAMSAPERFSHLILTAPPAAWATRAAQKANYLSRADLVEERGVEALAATSGQTSRVGILVELEREPAVPDIRPELLPTIFRGAALSDLPSPESLSALTQRTLVLAWAGDPGHPESTAKTLAQVIPGAELHVARSAREVRAWGKLSAHFLSQIART